MKRLIQLIQIPEFKPLHVMNRVFIELCGAFMDHNCDIRIVTTFNTLEDGGIIFLDNSAGNYINNKELYNKLAKICPNTVFICWYWEDTTFRPFNMMILTGEYYINLSTITHGHSNYMLESTFIPLKLRANDSPDNIGTYQRNVIRDYCFMGSGYRIDWVPSEFTGIYHQIMYNNYLSYDERREIYLSSMFAFGFQSDENIYTGHLSQRLFEGMAYGCIVLCENKLAADFTDNIIVYVSSKYDLIEKMHFYKNNPILVREKQILGYEWVKKYGTNRLSISLFLDNINNRFGKVFE